MELIIKKRNGDRFTVLYDECDHEIIASLKWHITCSRRILYARSNSEIKGKRVLMHRAILQPQGDKIHVDHINGNSLDNRRCNLRACTNSQNMMNRGPVKRRESEYKGIIKIEGRNRTYWRAQIGLNGKSHYIGSYDTPEDAAIAYNQKAIELHGEFAFLNVV
jgi:hypothetical protein